MEVPLPSSSMMISEFCVAALRIALVSSISAMKVETPRSCKKERWETLLGSGDHNLQKRVAGGALKEGHRLRRKHCGWSWEALCSIRIMAAGMVRRCGKEATAESLPEELLIEANLLIETNNTGRSSLQKRWIVRNVAERS